MQQDIETERLILRPFRLSDSARVAKLAGEKIIADMTANIPHPYEPFMAEDWIQTHQHLFTTNEGVVYAITLKGDDRIIGAVSFPKLQNGLGVLGYWLGVQYWGNGIAFEASKGLVEHGKRYHGLKQLEVMHLVDNERSKSVIKKLGVSYVENRKLRGQGQEVCVYRSVA
ncbi:GNAT family N-acetyltransferase [Vibrio lentus]|uniref:GNAT family N-acetyltransferase n=1 Tax=Vibrio lentus TaxID=136468 RepID=A0A2N7BY30_9VIBR|nr:GNAT family N-acetyltransferase [Vibrio lentus]PME55117.1 GNAT family N-acetyltransferase [Vibrio lentus]PME65820.1 GNAT family N-acetyltransferase [Vibrio lentus]PME88273.1 GNAT family N-acetyltransferase [Vibrio lentus]PMG70648.1 GNAT family N-acetyltransferase [Vibrio lentus]PMH93246.1 GNAT family N-acetyltransferase [Vibrio lentus]